MKIWKRILHWQGRAEFEAGLEDECCDYAK